MSPRIDVPRLLDRLGIRGAASGQWIVANCPDPDHVDRNPSWRINRDTGKFRCFSCGFHGGPVRLVMIALGLKARAAEEWIAGEELAAPAALEVDVTVKPTTRREFRLPAGVTIAPLAEWPAPPRDYVESRGVTAAQVVRWGLGYAVDGKQAGRVIFPVRDSRGVLVSYTGRSFTGARKKYREPDNDEGPDHGAIFGEQHWDRSRGWLVVTEGALDALAVERVTGHCVGAMYGSQIAPGHIARLSMWADAGIVLAVDADPAGDRVAEELRDCLVRSVRIVRWRPPVGEDCASLALKDPGLLEHGIKGAWLGA